MKKAMNYVVWLYIGLVWTVVALVFAQDPQQTPVPPTRAELRRQVTIEEYAKNPATFSTAFTLTLNDDINDGVIAVTQAWEIRLAYDVAINAAQALRMDLRQQMAEIYDANAPLPDPEYDVQSILAKAADLIVEKQEAAAQASLDRIKARRQVFADDVETTRTLIGR